MVGVGVLIKVTLKAGRVLHVWHAENLMLPDGRPAQAINDGDGPKDVLQEGKPLAARLDGSGGSETLEMVLRGNELEVFEPATRKKHALACEWR